MVSRGRRPEYPHLPRRARNEQVSSPVLVRDTALVDDVVAVKVELADGTSRYFLTFGRIQDVVEPGPLCELVLSHAAPYVLGTNVVGASICSRMREAAVSNEALGVVK
jgi:hypothetical protein